MRAKLLCASLALLGAAACDDSFGPRPRPTGIDRDTATNGAPAALLWYELQPRVIQVGADSVRLTAGVAGNPTRVQLSTWSKFVPMERVSEGVYSARVAVNDLLFGYRTGDFRNTASFVEVETATLTQQTSITVNVRDATMPLADVQSLSARVQATSHVANIRHDAEFKGLVIAEVLRTFYQFFADDFDFVAVLAPEQSFDPYSYFAARNAVEGLGLQTFDRGDPFGSNERLQGILDFPNDALYDPAETSVLHELSHRWMNFSNLVNLRTARPHFPISTLATGITGFTNVDPMTAQPNVFRFRLTSQPNGTLAVTTLPDRVRTFNDMELYLMGLLSPDSVETHYVPLNQDQAAQLRTGGVLTGPIDTITVAEWIARDGVRLPAYAQAQKTFRMATIVVSRNALLTREEMAFYHAVVLRAESETGLPAILATTRFTTQPFFAATGERARLLTRLRTTQPN